MDWKKKCFYFGDWFFHSLAHNRPTVTAFWAALGEQGKGVQPTGRREKSMGVKVMKLQSIRKLKVDPAQSKLLLEAEASRGRTQL